MPRPQVSTTSSESQQDNIPTKDWCYSVLSIDGGGARGLIPATVLARLQDIVGKAHPLHTLFD